MAKGTDRLNYFSVSKVDWRLKGDHCVAYLEERDVSARGFALSGDTSHVILQAAEQEAVSLIVIGTRGPSSVAELMLGNVTLEVLRYARCPVLVVP